MPDIAKSKVWIKAIRDSAAPERVANSIKLFADSEMHNRIQGASPEFARILAALFSGSRALSATLLAHPDWLSILEEETLRHPRRKHGFQTELSTWLPDRLKALDFSGAWRHLRLFRQRELLRIAARDLARLSHVVEITRELSDLADACLEAGWGIVEKARRERFGNPYYQDADGVWRETTACILGMGKLGGQELNYSSDVDLMFVYSEEGSVFKVPPPKGKPGHSVQTVHQFYNRLAEEFITEAVRMTPDGALFRIDMRLRPEGDAGPLCRSLASYENYYAQWGQPWERMMLIKTRGVAGDPGLAAEFLEMIQPFRYPRSMNESVLREVASMKDRIEQEVVKAGELDRNVKLGRGGIREVEFVVQSMQLLHAGRQPFLQGAQTLPLLEKLSQYRLLSPDQVRRLGKAYVWLRDVEHRLQMDENRQTHSIPEHRAGREHLAKVMNYSSSAQFEKARSQYMRGVRRVFESLLRAGPVPGEAPSPIPPQFQGLEERWKTLLAALGFQELDRAFRVLREFVEGPGYVHVSPRTRELAMGLLPRLFQRCPGAKESCPPGGSNRGSASIDSPLSDPDRVVTRLDSFIAAYGGRSTLFETWHSNPSVFDLLVLLFDRSEFLAELAIRTPDLVDELVLSGRLRQRKTSAETLRDLRHGIDDADQHLWLRRYHQAEFMRIGLRDILGLADEDQYLTELSALADACLQYALEVVMKRHRLRCPPFSVIGLGKLGGSEIDYGSDLDIVFVSDKRLPGKSSRVAIELMDLISARTQQGLLFQTDARLRPDGEKGVLVNSLKACEDYYRQRAALWEIQALSRTRLVAGDPGVGAEFQAMATRLTNFSNPDLPLTAYALDWKSRIHRMRLRIEKERTPAGKEDLAIKTGVGGLVDAEFLAQAVCLERGWQEPNTLSALHRAIASGVLQQHGSSLIEAYRHLRRVEGILRRWSYEGEVMLPDHPAPFYRVSVRCGFKAPKDFQRALSGWRRAIRTAYAAYFGPP